MYVSQSVRNRRVRFNRSRRAPVTLRLNRLRLSNRARAPVRRRRRLIVRFRRRR